MDNQIARAKPDEVVGLLTFTPRRLAILVPYAFVLWMVALSTIHFRGPHGLFSGWKQVALYALTIPITILINWLHLKLAKLPKSEIVNAVSLTLAVATTIDGLCFGFHPEWYSDDAAIRTAGAAWLLWAGAIACFLAFLTLLSAKPAALSETTSKLARTD